MNKQIKIGTGTQATVYRNENHAIKVFKKDYNKAYAFYEAMINSLIEDVGLPIAKVHEVLEINDNIAMKMDFIEGVTLHDCYLSNIYNVNKYVDIMVDMQIEIHSKDIQLPYNLNNRLREKISSNKMLNKTSKNKLLNILDKLPDGKCLCHGDFYGYNIIKQQDKYYIIDWIDATNGCDNADVCRTYMLYLFHSQKIAELYLETYCNRTQKEKKDVLDWIPIILAARLSENIQDQEKEKIISVIQEL
ncbi:phosphotransferase [Vallitalea guaymasensis]|uniref:phosphotransferase n=1 Tax=Vallitalea guaymasensis TaxID=1185412 RepID=UPI00272B65B3|nr:phosphotransferase [Vallitalea guaymasensis]